MRNKLMAWAHIRQGSSVTTRSQVWQTGAAPEPSGGAEREDLAWDLSTRSKYGGNFNGVGKIARARARKVKAGGFRDLPAKHHASSRNMAIRKAGAPSLMSRPDDSSDAARSGGDGRSGAARSHAQRPLRREHGEDGEHQTFPGASPVARSAQGRGTGGERGSSGCSRHRAAFSRHRGRDLACGRPFVGWPGASRLFGGRCRAG